MAHIVGIVKNVTGHFFAKDTSGNIIELNAGDKIFDNMIVFGDRENPSVAKISIENFSSHNIMTLEGSQSQLFDATVMAEQDTLGDAVISQASINAALSASVYGNSQDSSQNILSNTDENNQLFSEKTKDSLHQNQFDTRSGESIDINSDLRDAKFHDSNNLQFDNRIGDIVDINSDLRDAQFETTGHHYDEDGNFGDKTGELFDSIAVSGAPDTPIVQHTEMFISDAACNEGDGTITFTVSLVNPIGSNITFDFNTTGDSATSGLDFTAVSGSGIIEAGNSSTTITVPITDDFIVENSEQFFVNLTNPSSNVTIIDPQAIGTILDTGSELIHETAQVVLVAVNSSTDTVSDIPTDANGALIINNINTTPEGGQLYYIAVAVDTDGKALANQSGNVTVSYSDVTATNGDDYTPTTTTVAIGTTFSVDANNDYTSDNNETFTVSISNPISTPYENAAVDSNHNTVISAITDDTGTPNTPNDGVELTHESVIIALVTADANGNPVTDTDGNYVLSQNVNEGESGHYIALAFAPNTTPSPSTQIASNGTVHVSFTDNTATGATTQTTDDGTQDYNNQGQTVTIGQPFSTDIFDDYISDNGQTFNVSIDNGTYTPPTPTTGYENVAIDTTPVTTTITDDTGTPNTPNDGVEPTHESVIIKLVALNSDGSPVLDADNHYTFANDVNEGNDAKYMALAFAPNETAFAPSTQLANQTGTINLTFANNTATGTTTQTTDDGTQDFDNHAQTNVALGTVISTSTFDDYISDNNENFTIKIADNSYSPAIGGYENVAIDTSAVTTTIKDDTGTPNNPNDGVESDHEVAKVVLVATDASGHIVVDADGVLQIANTNSVAEGHNLYYKAVAVDADGKLLPSSGNVDVTFTNGSAVDNDYTHTTTNIAIGTVFQANAIDDFTSDDNENFTVNISNPTSTNYENVAVDTNHDSVTSTITDDIWLEAPINARVDEDYFDVTNANTNIADTQSLGIHTSDTSVAYTLSFDGNNPTFTSDDSSYTALKSDGTAVEYVTSGDTLTAYAGSGRDTTDRVFEVVLNKNNPGGSDDNYTYTQYKNIDHPTANSDDDITLTFGFNAKNDGTTSFTQHFNVVVNDSMPSSTDQTIVTNEDSSQLIVISQESFNNGTIHLDNGQDPASDVANGNSIDIYDTDKDDVVGTLTNNGDGTLTFNPVANYSGATNGFSYSVSDSDGDTATANISISVTPVADTPDILRDNIVKTYEDANTDDTEESDGNQREGGDVKILGLTLPSLNGQADQTDQNGTTAGDAHERFGLIDISFGNSQDFGTATIGYDTDGDGTLDGTLQTFGKNDTFSIKITGETEYHPTDLPDGTYSLTKAQYESLAIVHAEDNANNIIMSVKTTMHEVEDDGSLYNPDIVSPIVTVQTVTLDVQAVTDDITLLYNQQGDEGGSDNTNYTHTSGDEGTIGTIDLGSLLDATSGDLDGSEHRSYTVSGIPEGTVINVGGVEAAVAAGQTSVTVDFPDNTVADPTFTMKLPEQYSGTVNATITLTALDTDSDSSGTIAPKTASVTFDMTVNPVADTVTLQVAQAQGDEDAGRTTGNTANDVSASNIDAPENGIPLDIKVSSEDTDGSETYTVSISDIPDGGSVYVYDKSDSAYHLYDETSSSTNNVTIDTSGSGYKVTISDFDNAHTPKFIPPHNSDTDYNFTVSSYSVDSSGNDSSAHTQTLTMNVQVDGVADIPVNDGLATVSLNDNDSNSHNFNATTQEDSTIALKDVLADAPNLNSYDSDGSETLSIKVTNLADGFDITGAGATLIGGSGDSRIWFVDLAHFQSGDVILTSPTNYAGEIDFKIAMVTTEAEGDSKTHTPQDVSVMITPVADNATVNSHDTQNEDQTKELDFSFTSPDTDGANAGHEQLSAFSIDMDTVDDSITLVGSVSGTLNSSGVVNLNVTNGVLETVTATLPEDSNMAGSYDFKYSYSYEDTATDTAGNPYVSQVDVSDQTYTVDVNAITDGINMSTTTTTTDGDNSVEADGQTVHVTDSGVFTKTISIAGIDSDGRGNLDYDGSEQFTRITVSGVPEGISVGGSDGVYAGDTGAGNYSGFWYVDIPNEAIDGSTTYDLTFDVNGNLTESNTPYNVTITSYSEDAGNGIEQNDAQSFDLYIDQNIGGTSGTPAVITKFYQDIDQDSTHDHDYTLSTTEDHNITDSDAYQESVLREDTQFKLSDVVHVETDDTSSSFSITLKNVPDGVTIEGMTYNPQDGGFWTVSGSGNQQAIVDKLQSILITPISNANTDANDIANTDLNFDISLTTYAGDSSHNALINFTGSVLPVTDAMDLTTVNDGTTNEDVVQDFSITLDNSADGTHTHIVDGKVYIQLSENYTDAQGTDGDHGVLKLDGNVINTTSVSGVSGITDGDYYVIENVSPDQTLNFSFTPASNRNGTVTVDTYVKNIEQEDWNPFDTIEMTSHSTTSFDVVAVRDGFTFDTTTNPPIGDEDTMVQVSVAVSDPDSSELLTSVSLDKIPNGFLVYYGVDEASAVMAQNIGTNGTMTMQMTYGVDETVNYNLWNIPLDGGAMPAYIGIKAPENWSGVIPNVEFHAVDGSGDVSTSPFNITVTPVVDDITINPTQTFGDAGEDIALKLNANAVDLDGSETVTLTLKGLGADASFATDGVHTDATYDSGTDTYTIENIEAKHINDVTFTQSSMNGSVHVTAQMFEHGVTTGSTIVSGDFDVKVNEVVPTSGDDRILYNGNDIDALDGTDTIMLKPEGILDFSKLHNIEEIDLTPNGNHTISNLSLDDVLLITDDNNTLSIHGDASDSVTTVDKGAWSETSQSSSGGVTTHVYSHGSDSITLKVDDQIDNTGL